MDYQINEPIIIIGTGRSGTTILSEIVFSHNSLAWPSNYQSMFPSISNVNYLRRFFDNSYWKLLGKKKQYLKVSIFNKILFKPAEAYNMWNYIIGGEVGFTKDFLIHKKIDNERLKIIHKYVSKLIKLQGKERFACKITGPSRIEF